MSCTKTAKTKCQAEHLSIPLSNVFRRALSPVPCTIPCPLLPALAPYMQNRLMANIARHPRNWQTSEEKKSTNSTAAWSNMNGTGHKENLRKHWPTEPDNTTNLGPVQDNLRHRYGMCVCFVTDIVLYVFQPFSSTTPVPMCHIPWASVTGSIRKKKPKKEKIKEPTSTIAISSLPIPSR